MSSIGLVHIDNKGEPSDPIPLGDWITEQKSFNLLRKHYKFFSQYVFIFLLPRDDVSQLPDLLKTPRTSFRASFLHPLPPFPLPLLSPKVPHSQDLQSLA